MSIVCSTGNGSIRKSSVNGKLSDLHIAAQSTDAQFDTVPANLESVNVKGDSRSDLENSFVSVEEAVSAMKQGKIVILINPDISDDIGSLVTAGSQVTEESIAFMVSHGSGLIFCPAESDVLDRLELPLMMDGDEASGIPPLPFTITIDVAEGTSTGISAADRALTIRQVANPDSRPDDFRRPGHVIPLRITPACTLTNQDHAESAIKLAKLAGLPPVSALCAVTNSDGSMGQLADTVKLARAHGIPVVSVPEILREAKFLVARNAVARLPTKWGDFQIYCYTSLEDGIEHVALVKGDIGEGEDVLCRVHSECLTGDIFASARCDCGPQLDQAMQRIGQAGRGVLVYMRGQEGRGIGLGKKLMAYNLQDLGRDTVEANEDLGLPVDAREYGVSAQILRDLNVKSLRLMTNNPAKFEALRSHGIEVKSRVPVMCPITLENKRYLETKREKMGHMYSSDLRGLFGRVAVEGDENEA